MSIQLPLSSMRGSCLEHLTGMQKLPFQFDGKVPFLE